MLDAYIIEDIKRQEEARRRAEGDARPRLWIEIDRIPLDVPPSEPEDAPDEERGPVQIDIDDAIPIRPPSIARSPER